MSASGTFTYSMCGQLKLGNSMVAFTTQVIPLDRRRLRLDATFPRLRNREGVIWAMLPNRTAGFVQQSGDGSGHH